LKPLGFRIEEIEFGDIFFKRNYSDTKINQRQFIHFTSGREVENQLISAGFKIVLRKSMGELSKEDANLLRGSLSKTFNSHKSPIFYVCLK
jgi:hypothetical protein